jgi:hypothetical protein
VDDLLIYTGNICSFTTYKYHADVLEQKGECPFAISQQLYPLLERKKQTFYVNSYDFTLLLFVAFDIC